MFIEVHRDFDVRVSGFILRSAKTLLEWITFGSMSPSSDGFFVSKGSDERPGSSLAQRPKGGSMVLFGRCLTKSATFYLPDFAETRLGQASNAW